MFDGDGRERGKWNQTMELDGDAWKKIFTSLKNTCKETTLKEFFHIIVEALKKGTFPIRNQNGR